MDGERALFKFLKHGQCLQPAHVHAKIMMKRGKDRMIINYKTLNQNIIFGGSFISRKNVLINQVKHVKYFSKFDCKSGF